MSNPMMTIVFYMVAAAMFIVLLVLGTIWSELFRHREAKRIQRIVRQHDAKLREIIPNGTSPVKEQD